MNTRDAWTLGLHEIFCHFCFPFCVAHRGFFREAAWTHPSLKHAGRLQTHEAQSTTKVRYFCIFSSWKLRYLRLIRFPFCPFSFSTSARNCARCWQHFLLAFRSIASAVSRNEPARSLKLPIRFDYVRSSCFFISASVSRVAYQRAELSESIVDRFHEVFPQNHIDYIVFFSDLLNSKRRELRYRRRSARILCKGSRNPCSNSNNSRRNSSNNSSRNSNRISIRNPCARKWRGNCVARCAATRPRGGVAPAKNAQRTCSAIHRTTPLPPPWMGWDRRFVAFTKSTSLFLFFKRRFIR